MVRYLHSILLAGLLAGVLALGLGVGAAATAPMEPFVPPKAPTEPSDPETNGEMYYLNHFETYEELVDAIGQFIHYYNYQRRQHRLNCLAPMDYRSLLEAA